MADFPKYQWSKFVNGGGEQYVVRTDSYEELKKAKAEIDKENDDIATKVICPIHKVRMNHYIKGGEEWWSHKTESGEWCNGRDTKYNQEK